MSDQPMPPYGAADSTSDDSTPAGLLRALLQRAELSQRGAARLLGVVVAAAAHQRRGGRHEARDDREGKRLMQPAGNGAEIRSGKNAIPVLTLVARAGDGSRRVEG